MCKLKPLLEKWLNDAGSSMAYVGERVQGAQPGPVQTSCSQAPMSTWHSGLCDCCADMGICLCGTFVPCVLACQVAQDFGESCCLACLPGALLGLRTGLRERHRIQGSVCDDWLVMSCCGPCGLCQMARELTLRK
ncbi:cornifelin [Carettochelys insculpta]|uniref:cornifelin n=1 Tax=Carettochelys insculpta TaxID=44489 RepID=UPI003EC0A8D4